MYLSTQSTQILAPSNPTFLIRPRPVLLFRKNHTCPSWLSTGHVESQCTRNARNQLEAGILSLDRLSLGCTAAVMTTISGEMQRCAVVRIKYKVRRPALEEERILCQPGLGCLLISAHRMVSPTGEGQSPVATRFRSLAAPAALQVPPGLQLPALSAWMASCCKDLPRKIQLCRKETQTKCKPTWLVTGASDVSCRWSCVDHVSED